MTADVAEQLRALARGRAEGRLTLAAYRQLRRPLLDRLVGISEEQSSVTTQPRATARQNGTLGTSVSGSTETPEGSATPEEPASPVAPAMPERRAAPAAAASRVPAAPGGNGLAAKGIAATAAVVGGLVALAAVFLGWRHGALVHNAASASVSLESRTNDAADPIRQLLQPLLESPDWSDARLLELNHALLEAGPARISTAKDADWFNAFVEQVRSRVREQQALAGAPLSPDKSPLAALATTLGIDLASPDRPIRLATGSAEQSAGGSSSSTQSPAATQARKVAQPIAATGRDLGADGARHSAVAEDSSGESSEGLSQSAGSSHAAASPAKAASPSATSAMQSTPARDLTHSSGTAHAASASARSVDTASVAAQPTTRASGNRKYPPCSAQLDRARLNYCQDLLASGAPAPLLAVIPPGTFMMGNADAAQERPVHRVTVSHPFAMSVYEVSQSEYRLYCQSAAQACPAQPWTEDDLPAVEVSWPDANSYARWLSQSTGQTYRLPTEAEWEYAARAGQTGLYPSGDSLSQTDAYFTVTTTLTAPTPRSQRFNANAWRLMHMVGNIREWVADDWAENFAAAPADVAAYQGGDARIKVVRGGSYADRTIKLRLTTREPLPADTRDRLTGIRLVREIH